MSRVCRGLFLSEFRMPLQIQRAGDVLTNPGLDSHFFSTSYRLRYICMNSKVNRISLVRCVCVCARFFFSIGVAVVNYFFGLVKPFVLI
jgi:hypothetical protein